MNYYDTLLKDVFTPTIRYAELQYSVLANRIKRSSKRIKGDYVVWPVMTEGEQGIGAGVLRDGAYPTYKQAEFVQGKLLLKANRVALQMSGVDKRVLSSGTPNEQVASQLAVMVASLKDEWATDINRQYWGDGTGKLATVATTVTSATVEVDTTKYLRTGMYITNSTPFNDHIASIDHDASTITTDSSHTWTAGETMVRYGAGTYEIGGLGLIVADSGAYATGIDRDANPMLASYVKNIGAALDFTVIDTLIAEVIYVKGGKPTILIGCKDTANWLSYLWKEKYGATPQLMNVELGYKAIAYTTPMGTIPFIVEPHAPDHQLWAIDEKNLWLRSPAPFAFVKGNDTYWFEDQTNDTVKARGNWYAELVHETPWHCGKIHNYTTPVT